MTRVNFEQLLEAGAHFGHLKRKWNPNMAPYIFMEKNGIHIIDLHKTVIKTEEACKVLQHIARSGKKILFVSTKKQAKEIIAEHVKAVNMPYVTERWAGGMLTNFNTIRKAEKKMSTIDNLMKSPEWNSISKRERLQIQRERAKLEKNLGSISDLTRLPAAVFVVDIMKEHIAVAEARKLDIPIFAIVDTNSNPNLVDYPIPANDDASKSIAVIIKAVCEAIQEGLNEKSLDSDKEEEEEIVEKDIIDKADEEEEEEKSERTGRRRRRIGEASGDASSMDEKKKRPSKRPVSKK